MVQPRFRWDVRPLHALEPAVLATAERLGLSPRVAALLVSRGLTDPAALERFLGLPAAGLHDAARLPDAGRFIDRIARARERRERVMVFGDFDADGLTGLAILVRVLRRLEIETQPYVPSRLDEGHGLSRTAVDRAAADGVGLIVTVDCGSTNVGEVEAARNLGIDVLVTDHHRVPSRLPAAVAIVNPHRSDSEYPESSLSGSGVAFKLGQLLLAGEASGPAEALDLADLAIIGTVADVAPVLGENRAIARLGLERLRTQPRPGLAALLHRAGRAAGELDLEDIGFVLAPRLNAAGRMGEALVAARLLLTDDRAEADELAEQLESANTSRRELMRQAIAEARVSVDSVEGAPATIVRGAWPVGIVGLVAGRLADERGRPAIVGADLGEIIRASCRSSGGLDLAAALETCGDLLLRHGGHAAAAGFEIRAADWDAFRDRFLALAGSLPAPGPPSLAIDLDLPARAVDYALLRDLGRLAPCGPGHPEPLLLIRDLAVVRGREVTGGHTQLTLRRDPDVLDAIAFGWPELASQLSPGDRVDVVAGISSRRFGGFESLQLVVQDAAIARASVPVVVKVAPVEEGVAPGAAPDPALDPAPDPAFPSGSPSPDLAPGLAP